MKLNQLEMSTFKVGEVLKVGQAVVNENINNAKTVATCGFNADCSGGGGQCGFNADCSGGGGKCGFNASCSGT